MPTTLAPVAFGRIGDLLELIGQIRRLPDNLTSAEGLRQALSLLLGVARFAGVDPHWIERIEAALANEALLNVLLAVVRYVYGAIARETDDGIRITLVDASASRPADAGSTPDDIVVDAQSLIDWLPIAVQIIGLLRQIRGGQ